MSAASSTTDPSATDGTEAVTAAQMAQAIGASLAAPVTELEVLLRGLREQRALTPAQLDALDAALHRIHSISLNSQQLGRLADGHLRESHERLALHEATLDVLMQPNASWRRSGLGLRQQLRPVEVIVDPGLLVSLLETSFGWAAQMGEKLLVKLGMKNWPEHGLLVIRALQPEPPAGTPDARVPDNLPWQLVVHTARAMGVIVRREITPAYVQLSLEFPRTVRSLSGLTSLEGERHLGPDTWQMSHGAKAADGATALLVTDDHRLQREVKEICRHMRMNLDCAPNMADALRQCKAALPALIIIDQSLHDESFDALRAEVARKGLDLPAVEITSSDSGFELSTWDDTSISRVGRDAVAQHLQSAMTLALGQ
jgi:hypothetical protein